MRTVERMGSWCAGCRCRAEGGGTEPSEGTAARGSGGGLGCVAVLDVMRRSECGCFQSRANMIL